ncbi:MAG: SurA N-terminal domain-containing protein [Bdellovibrionales bacterium]|nr:SurA N-terminal domain-containing protein [Bdellovibrionales bacterium]
MLKQLRKHKRSIFGTVIVGFCVLLMIPFGTDMIRQNASATAALTVGGEEISQQEYYLTLNRWQNAFRQQLGENYQRMAGMLNLEQRAIDDLINGVLLEKLADAFGFSASTAQIEEKIRSHPFFGGNITKSSYEMFLQMQGLTGAGLEVNTRKDIIAEQLNTLLSDLSAPTDAELRAVFVDQNRKASFAYATFAPKQFEAAVDVSDEAKLEEYYIEHSDEYREPRAVRYTFAAFPAADHKSEVELTEEDLRDRYERRKHELYEPQEVNLRRILLKKEPKDAESPLAELVGDAENGEQPMSEGDLAKRKAEQALSRIEAGEDFAAVAKELSEDDATKAQGGEIGWVRYSVLDPAVRDAAANLEPGAVSRVLSTAEGYELVQVEGKKERRQKEFEEVRAELEDALRAEDAPIYARAAADDFLNQLEGKAGADKTLVDFGREKNVPTVTSEQLMAKGAVDAAAPAGLLDKIMDLPQGDREVVTLGTDAYVVEVIEERDSYIPEFAEVKEKVIANYRQAKAAELAEQKAEELLAKVKELSTTGNTPALKEVATEFQVPVETSEPATRATASAPPLMAPDARQTAFTLSKENSLADKVFSVGTTYYVLQLASEQKPEDSEFQQKLPELQKAEGEKAGNRLATALIERLRAEEEIWVNPDLATTGGA